MKKPTSAAIGKALDVLLWLHENTSDGQDRASRRLNQAIRLRRERDEALEALRGSVRAHEAITARFRAGTPKPPPKWAFSAMERARSLIAALSAPKEGPIHRSIGRVAEPNYMGDCEACGEPWPCLSAPKEGPE